jgi:FkbM family methyltransferase
MYYCIYEEHLVNWIPRNIRPGDAVIGPGTNIGYIASYLLDAINPGGDLICLEPSRQCFEALVQNNPDIGRNGMHIFNAALSHGEGIDEFCETSRIVSAGYGFLKSASQPPDEGNRYAVPTHSVDSLMESFGIETLRFLKLDIEGSELNPLRGATKSLESGNIEHIMVETNVDPDSPLEVARNSGAWAILMDAGFSPHTITRAGRLVPLRIPPAPNARFRTNVMWRRNEEGHAKRAGGDYPKAQHARRHI